MRYQAIIAVRVWADSKEEAERLVEDIVMDIPNSFQLSLSRLPHGSEISLVEENPPNSDSLISKADEGGR